MEQAASVRQDLGSEHTDLLNQIMSLLKRLKMVGTHPDVALLTKSCHVWVFFV